MLKRLGRRMAEGLNRLKRSDKGMAAIEFAVMAPPFFLLLGVIVETGLMLFTEYTLQSSTQDAARLVRTGQVQSASMTAAQFKTKICGTVGVLIDCAGKVTVYVRSDADFATLQNNLPPLLTIGPSINNSPTATACYNPGKPAQPAAVVATYDWYFNMWGMSYFGNVANNAARRINGFAIFLNEPYPGTVAGIC